MKSEVKPIVKAILFCLMVIIGFLVWRLLMTPKTFTPWLVVVFLLVTMKFLEGLLVYKVDIDIEKRVVVFGYTLGNRRVEAKDVIEWGTRYEVQHTAEGLTTESILYVKTKDESFYYPYHYWSYNLLKSEHFEMMTKVWGKQPKRYLNTKGPVWLADVSAMVTSIAFIKL